ncbi:hypothetical protein KCP73_16420 [Salmonella enterica subsp. enterica]|nr:hypothetical protein KCP73_16420 [Salmonella enterica subsp. enterica]
MLWVLLPQWAFVGHCCYSRCGTPSAQAKRARAAWMLMLLLPILVGRALLPALLPELTAQAVVRMATGNPYCVHWGLCAVMPGTVA